MKLSSVAVVMLLVVTSSAFGWNMLQNASLETPGGWSATADYWTRTGFVQWRDDPNGPFQFEESSYFTDWGGHDGVEALWFKSFLGGAWWHNQNPPPTPATSDLYQDVAGNAGDIYNLSAWFKFETYYSGLNPLQLTVTLLAIDYLDAGSNVISSSELNIDTVMPTVAGLWGPGGIGEGTGNGDGLWHQFNVSGVAPAGTAYVRARASMIDGMCSYFIDPNGVNHSLDPQSAFVDDLVLTPEPAAALGLLTLTLLGLRRR